ncbi:protein of unknown function [Kyrpidia spormannii]|uniref:Uncharacterized protein n=2 Tax=Kyrpidia spormannii TaxID=2055160 RepID=A0ACA8Z6B6_9BACL|nr:protein of unknown function [Kyrpidia spormannii]CAB3391137.1 protein of unknown function [Kyrpidia spormannii]
MSALADPVSAAPFRGFSCDKLKEARVPPGDFFDEGGSKDGIPKAGKEWTQGFGDCLGKLADLWDGD